MLETSLGEMVVSFIFLIKSIVNILSRTALHHAAYHGQQDVVRLLIDAQAKLDTIDAFKFRKKKKCI